MYYQYLLYLSKFKVELCSCYPVRLQSVLYNFQIRFGNADFESWLLPFYFYVWAWYWFNHKINLLYLREIVLWVNKVPVRISILKFCSEYCTVQLFKCGKNTQELRCRIIFIAWILKTLPIRMKTDWGKSSRCLEESKQVWKEIPFWPSEPCKPGEWLLPNGHFRDYL